MYEELNRLTEDWKYIKAIIPYGLGMIGLSGMKQLMEEFEVPFIVDNSPAKRGTCYQGIPILSEEEARTQLREYKIIVMTGNKAYQEIAESLTKSGMCEYVDFCRLEQFVVEWNWKYRNRACLTEVHTAVTTNCTLRCKNCNMFVPYYEQHVVYTVEEMSRDFDLLFHNIDFVFRFVLLGGEPFLNTDIGEILEYLCSQYGTRMGSVEIITNGSVLPDDRIMEIIRKYSIKIMISDYSGIDEWYDQQLKEFVELLQVWRISYSIRTSLQWCDFGFPVKDLLSIPNEKVRGHMLNCSPIFHGLNDGKFYYCHVAWSAEKCERYALTDKDYITLQEAVKEIQTEERERILAHSLGYMEGEYLSLCKVCGGCGSDNKHFVKAAMQIETN